MLVKNGFERIDHFTNHPEMLPHRGNDILIVSECVNLPGDFFVDKAESFMNWYETPTPKHFEGMSDADWRLAKVYFDVQQTLFRNYDKYAEPKSQRLFYEVSELYNKIIEETLKRRLNAGYMYYGYGFDMQHMHRIYAMHGLESYLERDSKERWKDCGFCTYYQRPNLTAGEFQEIMPNEDEYAFEIFKEILQMLSPKPVIVLSAKASASIKKFSGEQLPYDIHFFNSAEPSEWSEEEQQDFVTVIEARTERQAARHLKEWLKVTEPADRYFVSMIEEILFNGHRFPCGNPLKTFEKFLRDKAVPLLQRNPLNLFRENDAYRHRRRKFKGETETISEPWFNIYPQLFDTEKIFPLSLVICSGEAKLSTALDEMIYQAEKIAEAYPKEKLVKRNVVLLTDKWDDELVSTFKEKFNCCDRLVHFVFMLVTESDIERVRC